MAGERVKQTPQGLVIGYVGEVEKPKPAPVEKPKAEEKPVKKSAKK